MLTSVSAPFASASGTRYSSLRVLLPPYASPELQSSRFAQMLAPARCVLKRSSGCTGLGPNVSGWRGKSARAMSVSFLFEGVDDRYEGSPVGTGGERGRLGVASGAEDDDPVVLRDGVAPGERGEPRPLQPPHE